MFRHLPNFRRVPLRLAHVAGLFSTMLLFTAKPIRAANSAQEQVSRNFHQTVALGAGQSVRVEHKFGSVSLHGESGREVKIFRHDPGAGQLTRGSRIFRGENQNRSSADWRRSSHQDYLSRGREEVVSLRQELFVVRQL